MPRFFFDIDWEGLILADDEGLEFPTALAAREEAARAVAEMVSDGLVDDAADARLLVRGENGDALFEVKLASEARPEDYGRSCTVSLTLAAPPEEPR